MMIRRVDSGSLCVPSQRFRLTHSPYYCAKAPVCGSLLQVFSLTHLWLYPAGSIVAACPRRTQIYRGRLENGGRIEVPVSINNQG